MTDLFSLARLPLRVLPNRLYRVEGPPPGQSSALDEQVDARGYFQDTTPHVYSVRGVLTGVTKENIALLPEGMSAVNTVTLTTETSFGLPGSCSTATLNRFTLFDNDGTRYMLQSRQRKGCVYQYLCELDCRPEQA